ncbi:GtrA family protein [Neoasaia chiangmaiensis]|nr:GtrA family protein [Neoasaia chiangmaiensis]
MLGQFFRFGVVGAMGFVWDAGTTYALRPVIGLTAAVLISYFVAATINWLFNRFWTFRGVGPCGHIILQWLQFLAANSFGFLLNRGAVFALCFTLPICVSYPVLPLAVGAFAGMGTNFTLSRRLVFREKTPETPLELARMTVELPGSVLPFGDRDTGSGPN